MTRREQMIEETRMLQQLLQTGEGAPSLEEKLRLLQAMRSLAADGGLRIDQGLLGDIERARLALNEAHTNQENLRELLMEATEPPWHPAVYVKPIEMDEVVKALVWFAGRTRIVNFNEGVDAFTFRAGDEVFLNNDCNLVMAKSPLGMPQVGETATFVRDLGDERFVIKHREDELIVDVSGLLGEQELKAGDQLRWDRSCWMAFERIERPNDETYVEKELPNVRPEQVGGQKQNLKDLLRVLTAALVSPDKAKKYGLPSRRSVLMMGPPGCGKTLMARVAASEVERVGGKKTRFFVVKPAEWESMWVGETQANIRRCFESIRRHAEEGYCVLFLDEVESVGRTRGSGLAGGHSDKFLAALLAEIDGFRTNQNTVIIAATNRKDMVDPALAERLSDFELRVRRPNRDAAREIFSIHLANDLPFSPNGELAMKTRDDVIDTAVSLLYSPNAENQIATIKFRDSTTRVVTANELLSGRVMEQICTSAKQAAFFREIDGGEPGLRVDDMHDAVDRSIAKLKSTLTRVNVRSYLDELPQDVEIVSVTPSERKVTRPHRYIGA